jgi:hypothetical protein
MALTPELWLSWNSQSCLLEEWCHLFLLVNNANEEEGPASAASLEVRETFTCKVEAHQTPAKQKADGVGSPWMSQSPYKKQLAG